MISNELLSPDLTYALLAREGPVEKPVEDRVGGQAVKSFASIGRDEGEDMFFEFLLSIYLKTLQKGWEAMGTLTRYFFKKEKMKNEISYL